MCSGVTSLVQHFRAPGDNGKAEGAVATLRAAFTPCQMLENVYFPQEEGGAMVDPFPSWQGRVDAELKALGLCRGCSQTGPLCCDYWEQDKDQNSCEPTSGHRGDHLCASFWED